jgi:hypothetical protein
MILMNNLITQLALKSRETRGSPAFHMVFQRQILDDLQELVARKPAWPSSQLHNLLLAF